MSALTLGSFGLNNFLTRKLGKENNVTPLDSIPAQFPPLDSLLISYPVKEDIENYKKLTLILKHYVPKKVSTLIFDNNLSVTPEEYDWLKRHNVKFFSPAVSYHKDFDYLPLPIKILSLEDMKIDDHQRPVTLGHIGLMSDKIKSFEKYYVEPAKLYPEITVRYSVTIDKNKKEEYENSHVLQQDLSYKNIKYMIAIGSMKDYKSGYLNPNVFKAMEHNCIPLLPAEHRFYYAMFKETIFEYQKQLIWYNDSYEKLYLGIISSIYRNINEHFPEFTIEYFYDKIKHAIK